MKNSKWKKVLTNPPPDGKVLLTKFNNFHCLLYRHNGLWWEPDGESYVHYEPTHWRKQLKTKYKKK